MPKYPDITVKLVGENGNAFNLIGLVRQALKRAGVPKAELDAFLQEATSGDYAKVLTTCMDWVEVE